MTLMGGWVSNFFQMKIIDINQEQQRTQHRTTEIHSLGP